MIIELSLQSIDQISRGSGKKIENNAVRANESNFEKNNDCPWSRLKSAFEPMRLRFVKDIAVN